jgi:hypothetical protein
LKGVHKTVIVALLLGVCLAGVLAGCGSGSGTGFDIDGRPLSSDPPSPFAGHWSGTWSGTESGEAGTRDVTIHADGTLTFTIANEATGANSAGAGSVNSTGGWQAHYRYAAGPELTERGSVAIGTGGHLLGRFETFARRDHRGSGTFDLVRQP